jgi:hypothetical protein
MTKVRKRFSLQPGSGLVFFRHQAMPKEMLPLVDSP